MTFETDSEVEGVWSRISYYIRTDDINSVNPDGMAQQIKYAMDNPKPSMAAQGGMDRLTNADYHNVAARNEKIRYKLLEQRIQVTQVGGVTRYMAKKGTRDGKALGGTFLKGKSMQEAVKDLEAKGIETKKPRMTYKKLRGY
jgi:hypothetical protein